MSFKFDRSPVHCARVLLSRLGVTERETQTHVLAPVALESNEMIFRGISIRDDQHAREHFAVHYNYARFISAANINAAAARRRVNVISAREKRLAIVSVCVYGRNEDVSCWCVLTFYGDLDGYRPEVFIARYYACKMCVGKKKSPGD